MNKIKDFKVFIMPAVVLAIAVIGIVLFFTTRGLDYNVTEESSYENKTEAIFKVLQIHDSKSALATESSDTVDNVIKFNGNTVLLVGEEFAEGQIVRLKDPKTIGDFTYRAKTGKDATVKVLNVN